MKNMKTTLRHKMSVSEKTPPGKKFMMMRVERTTMNTDMKARQKLTFFLRISLQLCEQKNLVMNQQLREELSFSILIAACSWMKVLVAETSLCRSAASSSVVL